jgi:hypothetical protein
MKTREEEIQEAVALNEEMRNAPGIKTGISLNIPENWDWGEKVLSYKRTVLQIKTSYSAAVHFLIDVTDPDKIAVKAIDELLFQSGNNETFSAVCTVLANYVKMFSDWSMKRGMLELVPNTLGGFRGAFYLHAGRAPTEQECFDAGVRSGLQRPRRPGLGAQLYYLASPFTNEDPRIQESNRIWVCRKADELIEQGIYCVSPIAHNLAVIKESGAPHKTGWDKWREHDLTILRKCDRVIVLKLPGWEKSVGVSEEVKTARELNIPVDYVEMGETYEPQ